MSYLLDANVFIAAKNLHYGFDFCPAFWSWIEDGHKSGAVGSVARVYDELLARDDDLSEWATTHRTMFADLSAEDLPNLAAVNRWANDSTDYDPAAKSEFADVADSFLVGQAIRRGHTIVTHERPSDSRKRIKVPNAAVAHGVSYCTPFQMLRLERARFVL